MNKEIPKKRKRKLKWQVKLILVFILIIFYSFFIGTKGIFIEEYKLETNKIESSMHGLKILQFSDLHYGSSINDKTIDKLVNNANKTKPDIVIFTGDLIDERYKLTNKEKDTIIKKLSKIKSNLGKYYITGEEDFKVAEEILNLAGFINIEKKEQLIYSNSSIPIVLMGKDNVKNHFEESNEANYYKIVAIHNPDEINKFKNYDVDVAIAGHTHNGGINIPKIKDLLINSEYKKNYQKVNNIKLFINKGIGTSKINVRLFNHPTIYLYRLNKASV